MNALYSVLVADSIHADGCELLASDARFHVDVETGLDEAALTARISDYDALIVRSKTRVTRPVIAAGTRLRVIGRAGIGVDNIDDAMKSVRSAGGEVMGDKMDIPGIGTFARCKDTEGNILGIMQHDPAAK